MDNLILAKQTLYSLFVRRKKWIAIATLAALAALLPLAYRLSEEPPRHRSTALVLVESRPDPSGAPLFQEFSPFRPLPVQLAILRSRALGQAVLDALPRSAVEDLVENPYERDYILELQNWLLRIRGLEPIVPSPQQKALNELQQARLRFTPQGRSGLVEMQVEAPKPRVALDILNTYIDTLLSRTRSFNVDDTRITREYLEQQEAQVARTADEAATTLRRFVDGRGGVNPSTRNAKSLARLSQLEQQLAEVQANKNMTHSRLAAMKAKLESLPVPAPVTKPAPAASTAAPPTSSRVPLLRAKLAALEKQLLEHEAVYTDLHPRVKLVKSQIAEVTDELGSAVKETQPTVAAASAALAIPAPDRAAFADAVATLETSVVTLGAQEEALREEAATVRQRLSGLSRDEQEFARLSTDFEKNQRLLQLINDKLARVRMREQGEMKVVKVIDPPHFPLEVGNQKRVRFLAVAAALALALGISIPGAIEFFSRPIQTEGDVRQAVGLPVLAVLPLVRTQRPTFSVGSGSNDLRPEEIFLFTEGFRRLRLEIQLRGRETPLRRILVASALPGEGKSMVVVNLGLAFGEIGKHVILADSDFHRPTLHRTLRTPNTKGFSDLLTRNSDGDVRDSMMPVADNVWLSPRGTSPTNVSRGSLASERLVTVLDRFSDEADYVIIDSSPVLLVPDNLYVAAVADAVILVVLAGSTRPRDLRLAKEVFEKAGTPVLGVVLNQVPLSRLKRYTAYYKYYRSYLGAESKA